MPKDVDGDQVAIIRIDGMHCHKCEARIRTALTQIKGVHEVEVDFASKQASVLFDPDQVELAALMNAITTAGYHAQGLMTNDAPTLSSSPLQLGQKTSSM